MIKYPVGRRPVLRNKTECPPMELWLEVPWCSTGFVSMCPLSMTLNIVPYNIISFIDPMLD